MKKIIFILALSTLVWSCGGGGEDTPPTPTPVNSAPTTPTLVDPTNNLYCLDNTVIFQWDASMDSDGDEITYQIEVAQNSTFTVDKRTLFDVASLTQEVKLGDDDDVGEYYYWRVMATDSENASSSYSSVYKFYTYGIGDTNQLPDVPKLESPELNSTITMDSSVATTTLQWTAVDGDTADITFDVYFGTNEDNVTDILILPEIDGDLIDFTIVQDGTDPELYSILNVSINATTTYYWKVVVNDGQGGQTIGQVWSFTTD